MRRYTPMTIGNLNKGLQMDTTLQDFGLPKKQLFFKLSEIKEMGLMSPQRAKQLLYKGDLKGVKNGQTWTIPRAELLRIIYENFTGNTQQSGI